MSQGPEMLVGDYLDALSARTMDERRAAAQAAAEAADGVEMAALSSDSPAGTTAGARPSILRSSRRLLILVHP